MTSLFTLHFPIQHFTGIGVHWLVAILFVPVAAMQVRLSRPSSVYFAVYAVLIALSAAVSLLRLPIQEVFLGSLSYVLLPVTFFLSMQFDASNRIRAVALANAPIALISGIAAYYQLNHDSVLFGLYAGTDYETLEMWGAPRAASFFYSPQIYAAYMAFSVVLHDVVFRAGKWFPGVVVTAIAAFALLSGSLSVVAGIGGYYIVKLVVLHWLGRDKDVLPKVAGYVAAVVVVVGLQAVFSYVDSGREATQVTQTERMLSAATGDGVAGAANASRLNVWWDVVRSTPFPFGHGIGSASTLVEGKDRPSTESYVLSLYYQGGVLLVAAMAVLTAAMFAGKRVTTQSAGFAMIFLIFAMVVPAYYAWALAIVWALLFWFSAPENERSIAK